MTTWRRSGLGPASPGERMHHPGLWWRGAASTSVQTPPVEVNSAVPALIHATACVVLGLCRTMHAPVAPAAAALPRRWRRTVTRLFPQLGRGEQAAKTASPAHRRFRTRTSTCTSIHARK